VLYREVFKKIFKKKIPARHKDLLAIRTKVGVLYRKVLKKHALHFRVGFAINLV
jgi:hypothetical protein